ncbi:PREDICTED: endoplasmic reticulum metallopeptidase 1-like [Nicrophorus vespilloides]|uniref:Endoplasmic reticulum metallopeptidase 1-like n=1 Tax=Nicrophorus vespilloides TaxID=110193 RepID=A0ABM1NEV1_NICVS|nr:PREDICTED: endoplasmic reticulum metallopeptidase 1-like [Nicrophorus vespilloides]
MANFKYDLGDEKDQGFPIYLAVSLIVLLGGLFAVVWAVDATLPFALTIEDEAQKADRFIAGRAQDHLKGLTDIGPRVVGSVENEILTVDYLKSRIEEILNECKNPGVDIDHQIQSGAFYLDYRPYGSINAYSNLQNLVVRLPGEDDTKESILINSHFDTMPNSPGGSDDGIMCAVMLELLRHMCNEQSKSNLIFLFNGAEESYLQGSHAFIANENKWNDRIKLVINLEATGAGGKEMLFQAGPQQYWLLDHYSQVPHPHAQVAGEEIFESNLIPSDTDFRIFRDFGNTIGYDMAYTRNGYRYHSENDGFENIDVGTFQHTGDNVLALVRALSKVSVISKQDPNRKPIFYDMFGLFLVYYEENVEVAVNIVAILLSLASAILGFYRAQLKFSAKSGKCLIINLLGTIVGWLLALAFVLGIGAILDAVNKTMSWYRFPFFVAGLYVIPVFLALSLTTMLLLKYNSYENLNGDVLIIIHINRLIWTVILLAGTALSIRSSYILIFPIYFTSIALVIINVFKLEVQRKTWQIVYVISTVIPTMFSMYIALEVYGLFVPICGRSGSESNPEFIIGLFTWIIGSFILSFYASY